MTISIRTFNRVLCAGALVLAALPAMAQGMRGSCGGGGPRGGFGACANLPGLTEAQKTAITALETQRRPVLEEKRQAAWTAHEVLRQAMAASATDRTALKGAFDKESQARFAMIETQRSFRQDLEKLLTPEQKAWMDQRCGEGPGMGRGRGGRGRGMRDGMGMGMGHGEGSCPQGQH